MRWARGLWSWRDVVVSWGWLVVAFAAGVFTTLLMTHWWLIWDKAEKRRKR